MRVMITWGLVLALTGGLAVGLTSRAVADESATLARIPKAGERILLHPASDSPVCGEDFADALVIGSLPYSDAASTCDNVDDYHADCPVPGSGSPDVVYSFTATSDGYVRIDLCGSLYDTKLFVMDATQEVLACNDDAYYDPVCGYNTSLIPGLPVSAGDCGDYVLNVSAAEAPTACTLPVVGQTEGEPPLFDGYVDAFNGGCNSADQNYPFQDLKGDAEGSFLMTGKSGWYDAATRDTDWFIAVIGSEGVIEWTLDGEQPIQGRVLAELDCVNTISVDEFVAGPCSRATITVHGEPGGLAWFWIAPLEFVPPAGFSGHEFRYNSVFSGLQAGSISTDEMSWDSVKSLYR